MAKMQRLVKKMIKTMISNDFDVAYSVYYCIAILWSLHQILIFISWEGCHRVCTGHGKSGK